MRWLLLLLAAAPVQAETLVAARTVRAQSLLAAEDLGVIRDALPGMLTDPAEAIGQEARITLYAGRPIRPTDIGPPPLSNATRSCRWPIMPARCRSSPKAVR